MIWSRVISINETTTSRCVKPFSLKKPDRDAAADRTLRRAACCPASAQNVRPCSFLGSGALEINHLDRLFLRRKVAKRTRPGLALPRLPSRSFLLVEHVKA